MHRNAGNRGETTEKDKKRQPIRPTILPFIQEIENEVCNHLYRLHSDRFIKPQNGQVPIFVFNSRGTKTNRPMLSENQSLQNVSPDSNGT